MESIRILIDGVETEVFGVFYIYDSKYYFIYTQKEIDENGYVVLYMTQIGKETQSTANGPVETGFMVGMEISDPEEQKKVQTSISYIVEDKKNGTINPQIQYLPMSMLTKLKIVSKKRFRLLKTIMTDNFKLNFDNNNIETVNPSVPINSNVSEQSTVQTLEPLAQVDNVVGTQNVSTVPANGLVEITPKAEPAPLVDVFNNSNDLGQTVLNVVEPQIKEAVEPTVNNQSNENNVIIDYRAKYFEMDEKNKELQLEIEQLTQKLNDIRKVLE